MISSCIAAAASYQEEEEEEKKVERRCVLGGLKITATDIPTVRFGGRSADRRTCGGILFPSSCSSRCAATATATADKFEVSLIDI